MSCLLNLELLCDERREEIEKDLTITLDGSTFNKNVKPRYMYPYDLIGNDLYIPFAYGKAMKRASKIKLLQHENYPEIKLAFKGNLRPEQKVIKKEAIQHLNETGSTLIAAYPGFGKTATSIYLSCKVKRRVLVITHRIVLINQWKDSIKMFVPKATVQVLKTKSQDEGCDFCIVNAINMTKMERSIFQEIGLVIVDEAHLIMSEILSQSLNKVCPQYVIGLSATPYRPDGMNALLDLFLGTQRIVRKLYRKHQVYKIQTSFKPKVEKTLAGRLDWNKILNEQAENDERNEMILNIVKFFPNRVFLILCKRVGQARHLAKRLTEEGEDVTSLIGKQQTFEKTSRVLVGSIQKTGVGFDHKRLDALILAGDVQEYYIQILGRIFRLEDSLPLVFDIVDNNSVLKKHYLTRQAVYLEHGGKINNFKTSFPNFQVV